MISRRLWLAAALTVSAAAHAAQGIVVWYNEQEQGTGAYPVRYIVTDDFLRSDGGGDPNDGFVLLDRRHKTVYNVVRDSKTILVIDGSAAPTAAPPDLRIDERWSEHADAPPIDGKPARELQVFADDHFCYGAVVIPGLDEKVTRALQEFQQVLATRQLKTLDNTPEEFRDVCFMTRYVYAPARHLSYGLPIEEWDVYGRRKSLVKAAQRIDVDDALFTLPPDYRRY